MTARALPGTLATIATLAGKELRHSVQSPVAAIVAASFLVVQGLSFWGLLGVYSQPGRSFEPGALFADFYGGTFLSWALIVGLTSALSMRLVAEERRSGTLEALVTTGAPIGSLMIGKWLGAVAVYALMWSPTILYAGLLALLSGSDSVDPGALAGAYLGIVSAGAGLLALGLACSAATSSQAVAAAAVFAISMALLVIGELPELAPGWLGSQPQLAAVVDHLSLRRMLAAFSTGRVELTSLIFFAGMVVSALALASLLVAAASEGKTALRRRLITAALVVVNAGLGNLLSARWDASWQLSDGNAMTLAPQVTAVLRDMSQPIDVVILRPSTRDFDDVYRQVDRLVAVMEEMQPLVRVRRVDSLQEPERIAEVAAELAIEVDELSYQGAIVFESPTGQRFIDLPSLAEYSPDLGIGGLVVARAQERFAQTLVELSASDQLVCTSTHHGEFDLAAGLPDHSWIGVGQRLVRRGLRIEEIGSLWPDVPARCDALVLAGPAELLSPDEALAVMRHVEQGRGLLVALRARAGSQVVPKTGLELVLGELGIALPRAIVVSGTVAGAVDAPLTWSVSDGYGDHAITSLFHGRRRTLWQSPRMIGWARGAEVSVTPLVIGPEAGWAETDVDALLGGREFALGQEDIGGAQAVAVAVDRDSWGKVVVLGSAESFTGSLADLGIEGNELFAETSVAWVVDGGPMVSIAADSIVQGHRPLSVGQLRVAFAVCAVAVPVLVLMLALLIWWRRRRG